MEEWEAAPNSEQCSLARLCGEEANQQRLPAQAPWPQQSVGSACLAS